MRLTAAPKVIHAFVALCDNASQGIVPVPAKIGNGDDPLQNLYWGCDDGLRTYFSKSKSWKRISAGDPDGDRGPIMERLVFRHTEKDAWLVADAYRGKEIKRCLTDYFAAIAGLFPVEVKAGDVTISAGGGADMIAYLGHDGLMEFDVEVPAAATDLKPKTAVALCCISKTYFAPKLSALKATPLLLTTQLMYPGSFLLHEAANGWLADRSGEECVLLAARAYAKNQKISVKAATGVFWTPVATAKK